MSDRARRKLISDPELLAMGEAVAALESLAPEQRARLASYLFRRYVPDPREKAQPPPGSGATLPLFPEGEGQAEDAPRREQGD